MMTQDQVVDLLKNPGTPDARGFYLKLSDTYREEYGIAWLIKEIQEARHILQGKRNLVEAVRKEFGREFTEPAFIGTKQASGEDYGLYYKGLMWLAAYDLLNR